MSEKLWALSLICIFSVQCSAQTCMRDGQKLHDLASAGLGLIEIQSYGDIPGSYAPDYDFARITLRQRSDVAIGVTQGGDGLLVETTTEIDPQIYTHNVIDVISANGVFQSRFRPSARSIGALEAEMSPDGRKVPFVGAFAFPKNRGVNLISSDGRIRNLVMLEERSYPDSFGWSSSGTELVYDTDKRIYVYSLANDFARLLVEGTSPTWSPKGDWIAYRDLNGGASLISPDGSKTKDILPGIVIRRGLRWSPDGRYLLFANSKTYNIQVVDLATNQISNILCPIDGTDESRLRWVSRRF